MYLPSINTPDGIHEFEPSAEDRARQPGAAWIEAQLEELDRRLDRARDLLDEAAKHDEALKALANQGASRRSSSTSNP